MEVAAHDALIKITGNPDREFTPPARDIQEGIADAFDREFSCINADVPALRIQAYKIRHDVYCLERKYEDPDKNAAGVETDEFDSHAPHKLLFHHETGRFAGVVRLILPSGHVGTPRLPFTRHLNEGGTISDHILPAPRTAEVSRFAISRQFRERLLRSDAGISAPNKTRSGSTALLCYLSVGLMRAVVEMAAEHGITHLCALMEPALLRLLGRLGVHFEAIGPKIDYHGWRQPCFADLDLLLARTWMERRDIWEILTDRGRTWPLSPERGQRGTFAALTTA